MNTGMGRHAPDAVSLVSGAAFLAVVTLWLAGRVLDLDLTDVGWILGVALVAVGVLGLWHTIRPRNRDGA